MPGALRKVGCASAGLSLGLAVGWPPVWLTDRLEGCAVVKLRDNSIRLLWATDGVLVRTLAICGLTGTILGAAAHRIRAFGALVGERTDRGSRLTNTVQSAAVSKPRVIRKAGDLEVDPGSPTAAGTHARMQTVIATLVGATVGFSAGAILIRLPAAIVVILIRSR